MAKNTAIEWAHHTFNPWRGCTKVSPACDICYAEKNAVRNAAVFGLWGKYGTRVIASDKAWQQPVSWNRAAASANERHRVFCASLADVFEGEDTMPDASIQPVHAARHCLGNLIRATESLDWLLLTKRPENIQRMIRGILGFNDTVSPNVWLGTSVENRKHGIPRIDILREIPAARRFLSIEPLLEDLGEIDLTGIHWVIVGGESGGSKARPMHPRWVRSVRDQCIAQGVAFFFKQWGHWSPAYVDGVNYANREQRFLNGQSYYGVGKALAGRMLDSRTWDELPQRII